MKAFLTGSHAYGAPTSESDVDLVVLVTEAEAAVLREQSETKQIPHRYGNLNLIILTDVLEYNAWATFTKDMQTQREDTGQPVTKEEAKAAFMPRRIRCGSGGAK